MFPVIKGTAYTLFHCPNILLDHGTTQTVERDKNPASEYLKKLPSHLRGFEDCLAYPPNQAYIGALHARELDALPKPWYQNGIKEASRFAPYGEIMPEDEFYGIMKLVDSFDLVLLEADFAAAVREKLTQHPGFKGADLSKLQKTSDQAAIAQLVAAHVALPLRLGDRLVGCVRQAHDTDKALTAQIIFKNLASMASAVVSMRQLFLKSGLDPKQVDYIVECSEEACGDMNQRGGGNFAKAIGEVVGCVNATGSDTRGFCAAPAHAMIVASSLVQSGVFKNVVVVAGGSVAKLGMNGKDHVNKHLPVLEDVLGGFAMWVAENDGVNPVVRTDIVGRHTIGSGASPQAVIQALVTDPLDRKGLKITDIDQYGVEMHNPEVTVPAGAGNVPEANYKMIAALGVKRGELERAGIMGFVAQHGMPGFAPTQGHVPSGVPVVGPARDAILAGQIRRAMIIGKGSLFLARMTNLFDGVSFVMETNPGFHDIADALETGGFGARTRVGITLLGSEHGLQEVVRGAELAAQANPELQVVLIGPAVESALPHVPAQTEKEQHAAMEQMLLAGKLAAAVTMHYNFPIGVSTVGRVITPGRGRELFLATTTGTSDTDRVLAMVKNAIYGVAVAKASGIEEPTVGILNLDGARAVERHLQKLKDNGYKVKFAQSVRQDGGSVMRGNDLLVGAPDVMITDTLTGNVLMKVFSAYTTGGDYEGLGYGYGPGVGEGYDKIVMILSRASGAPVIAGAIKYAGDVAKGKLLAVVDSEFAHARKAGLAGLWTKEQKPAAAVTEQEVTPPPTKVVTEEIAGIEILDLETAVREVWKAGIFASTGMGCTGPVILVAKEDLARALEVLVQAGHVSA
ncbi:MAG: Glycine/sarcosine/betaine reductase complex component C subunit beta [Firmicutes bacterium]|nr:Glycine/sarcosine/betaine reductase complex component C subunit beta [candidate division NPL-UPA2 bacterium]